MDFKVDQYNDVSVITVFLPRATLKHAAGFKDFTFGVINTGANKVIVDLGITEYIDSTFLGALVAALKKIVSNKGDLRLVYNSKTSTIIFELTSMNKVFKVYGNLEEALSGFSVSDSSKQSLIWK